MVVLLEDKTTVYTWADYDLDLKFVWKDCCPTIKIMYGGDCAEVVIDTLELECDPCYISFPHSFNEVLLKINNYVYKKYLDKEKAPQIEGP